MAITEAADITAFRVTPRELLDILPVEFMARNVPLVRSDPGMGKSSIARQVAAKNNLFYIDMRLATADVTDLTGFPYIATVTYPDGTESKYADFAAFEKSFPLDTTPLPKRKDGQSYAGWLINFDELPSAPRAVMVAAYKILLERMVGNRHLHPNCALMGCGNEATSNAIVNPMGTAMSSRLVHYHMVLDFEEFMEDVAIPQKWDPLTIAYLSFKKMEALHDFHPDRKDDTFCCPRTWEMNDRRTKVLRRLHNARAPGTPFVFPEWAAKAYAGTMTPLIGNQFVEFSNRAGELNILDKVLTEPETAPVPDTGDMRFFITVMLAEAVDDKGDNLKAITTYMNRLPGAEFKIVFGRSLLARLPGLASASEVVEIMAQAARRSLPNAA